MLEISRKAFIAGMGAFALTLAGCGGGGQSAGGSEPAPEPEEPLDLTGTWIAPGESDDSWMEAVIADGAITVYWVSDNGDTKSLYWAGTYVAPEEATDTYSWDSENDHEQTDTALMASGEDTKTFSYEAGELSWETSALGTTKTLHATKEE